MDNIVHNLSEMYCQQESKYSTTERVNLSSGRSSCSLTVTSCIVVALSHGRLKPHYYPIYIVHLGLDRLDHNLRIINNYHKR